MSNINYYFIDQIFLLQALVKDYKNNLISRQELISKIEELLDLLENYDALWCQEMRNLWFSLEIKHAMALSENRAKFSAQEEQEIENIIEEIFQMTENRVKDVPEDYWYHETH